MFTNTTPELRRPGTGATGFAVIGSALPGRQLLETGCVARFMAARDAAVQSWQLPLYAPAPMEWAGDPGLPGPGTGWR